MKDSFWYIRITNMVAVKTLLLSGNYKVVKSILMEIMHT